MNTDSLFRTRDSLKSASLLILEALRDFIVSTVDFKIVSENFLFHVEEHYSGESRDLMY